MGETSELITDASSTDSVVKDFLLCKKLKPILPESVLEKIGLKQTDRKGMFFKANAFRKRL